MEAAGRSAYRTPSWTKSPNRRRCSQWVRTVARLRLPLRLMPGEIRPGSPRPPSGPSGGPARPGCRRDRGLVLPLDVPFATGTPSSSTSTIGLGLPVFSEIGPSRAYQTPRDSSNHPFTLRPMASSPASPVFLFLHTRRKITARCPRCKSLPCKVLGAFGRLVPPLVFKTSEGSGDRPLVGSIPIRSRHPTHAPQSKYPHARRCSTLRATRRCRSSSSGSASPPMPSISIV